jgi:hypothetical protein
VSGVQAPNSPNDDLGAKAKPTNFATPPHPIRLNAIASSPAGSPWGGPVRVENHHRVTSTRQAIGDLIDHLETA